MAKPRIMFYHDGRHPLIYMYEPPMQKEEYEAAVDELAGTPVEAIMFCMGDGRTVLHDTKVGEVWGDPIDKWDHLIFRRAHQNARALIAEGNDPLRLICDRAHEMGMLVYPTLLVQQSSGTRGEDMRTSNFRLDNKHLEIGARGDLADFVGSDGLDFKREEVREERFALVQETLTRYPVDGFELNMNYSPYYFRPDEVEAGREIMTAWIRRIYEAVKDSGADCELAIRLPVSIEDCLSVGMDVREWLREGIVDVLIPQTFGLRDPKGPAEDFRQMVEAAAGSECRVQPAIDSGIDSDRLGESTIEMLRATATNYWAQGIDGLYLNQWFGNWPYQASFYEKMREVPYSDIMAPKDKSYYVPTTGQRSSNDPIPPGVTDRLPMYLEEGKTATVRFTVSDDLPRWDDVGRVHEVLLRALVCGNTELDRLSFKLNGQDLPDSLLRKINQMYRMSSPRYRITGYWYIFELDRAHWPVQGENRFEVTLHERDADVTPPIFLRDVELQTKYLMGKNYHRGFVDEDLGPYEFGSS